MLYKISQGDYNYGSKFLLPHFGLEPTGGFKIAYYYANYLSQKGYNVNIIHTASLKK